MTFTVTDDDIISSKGQQLLAGPQVNTVIRVHKYQILSCGSTDTGISGIGQTTVFLMDHPNSAVRTGIAIAHGRTTVRTAVIDQDDLNIAVGLATQGLDTFIQIRFHFVNRHNDRKHGLIHLTDSIPLIICPKARLKP